MAYHVLLLNIIVLFFVADAICGELYHRDNAICDYYFEGSIETGDAAKLEVFGRSVPQTLCLNSRGGSLTEGLKMFFAIWEGNANTVILPNQTCESACALAFMGGSNTVGTDMTVQIERVLFPGGRLGFHGPSLDLISGRQYPTEVVNAAFQSALRTAQTVFGLTLVKKRKGMAFPLFLYGIFLVTPPEKMYYIETVGDMILADISPAGLFLQPPQGKEEIESAVKNACENIYAKNPPADAYFTPTYSTREYYDNLDPFRDTWRRDEKIIVRHEDDGDVVGCMAPLYLLSKYESAVCCVKFYGVKVDKPEISSDDYKMTFYKRFPSDHQKEGFKRKYVTGIITPTVYESCDGLCNNKDIDRYMKKNGWTSYPVWYWYNHATKIETLPTNPRIIQ